MKKKQILHIYIDLGECDKTIKDFYNFPPYSILYILGIEIPNKD